MNKKIIKHFIIIIIMVNFYSCNKRDVVKEYYQDGKIKIEYEISKNVKSGFYNEYYNNGNIKVSSFFENGRQQGATITYFENGKKEREIFFKKGVQEGKCIFYYENGNLKESGKINAGKKNGEFKFYNSNGKLKSRLSFINDEIEGDGLFYNNDNEIEYKIKFKKSTPSNWINLNKDQFAFNLNFPKDWYLALSENKIGRVGLINKNSTDNYKPNINVVSIVNKDNLDVSLVINQNTEELRKSYDGFEILYKDENNIIYEILYNNIKIKGSSTFIECNKGSVFILTCLSSSKSYETYKPLYEIIKQSFNCN